MCLIINEEATANFKKNNRAKKVTIYKVVRVYGGGLIETLYQYISIKGGFFEAIGPVDYGYTNKTAILGGVIHAYVKLSDAKKRRYLHHSRKTIKCWAYAKDFVAKGKNGDICFKKIFIPKSELKRVRNERLAQLSVE